MKITTAQLQRGWHEAAVGFGYCLGMQEFGHLYLNIKILKTVLSDFHLCLHIYHWTPKNSSQQILPKYIIWIMQKIPW